MPSIYHSPQQLKRRFFYSWNELRYGRWRRKIESRLEWYKLNEPKVYADYLYLKTFGRRINWKHPRNLNEWINYFSFCTDTSEWSRLADKYQVREYIKEQGLADLLVPLYGKWDKIEDVDFEILPDSFVLKLNNGSGDAIVVRDKQKMDKTIVVNHFAELQQHDYGLEHAEPHYSRIKPCIIAEKVLNEEGEELTDYKILCINGEPCNILTTSQREISTHSAILNIFDLDWNKMNDRMLKLYQNSLIVPKPVHLTEMLEYASILSKGFPQVRVDFYEVNGKVYFGEMTFTAMAGRLDEYTPKYQKELGQKIRNNQKCG